MYAGIGQSLGSKIGGKLVSEFGAQQMFKIWSGIDFSFVVLLAIQQLFTYIRKNRAIPKQLQQNGIKR